MAAADRIDRDNRNVLAWGENGEECQRKLYDSRILVVGSDVLSQMILGGLAGLSIGHIYFMDNRRIKNSERDFLCSHKPENIGQKKVRHIEETLKKINQHIEENVVGIHSKFVEAFAFGYKPEIIIDGTNDPISKEDALRYALHYNIPFISASSDDGKSAVASYFPVNGKIKAGSEKPNLEALLMGEFEGARQEGFTSGVAAGLICEEIRKIKFKYTSDGRDDNIPNNERLVYNLYSDSRRGMESAKIQKPVYFKNKKVLVVGAGGIGNFVALNLALLGIGGIDVLDLDTVENHNLNRQILLYGREGHKKADVLAERIKEIDPFIKSSSIFGKVGEINLKRDLPWLNELYAIEKKMWEDKPADKRGELLSFEQFVNKWYGSNADDKKKGIPLIKERDFAKKEYDIILGCLDNKYARLWLNNFAINYHIPYIDGGTGPKSGQIAVYIPGKTKCVNCQLDLMHFPLPRSCAERPEGSVVMSNLVIGSMMVGEAVRAMYSVGDPIKSDLRYKAMEKLRIYLTPRKKVAKNHNCY